MINKRNFLLILAIIISNIWVAGCSGAGSTEVIEPTPTRQATFPLFPAATPITPEDVTATNPFGFLKTDMENILALEDVQGIVSIPVQVTEIQDVKSLLDAQQPGQTDAMDNWFSRDFITADAAQGISFGLVDYRFNTGAEGTFNNTVIEQGLVGTSEILGDGSGQKTFAAEDVDAVVMFIVFYKGDKYVELQGLVRKSADLHVIDMEGLMELAKLMDSRL